MEPANPNITGSKEKSKGKGKDGDARPTDKVRCPLGCKTKGYDSTTRYHEHLRKTHSFTTESMELITDLVRKNGHLSLGEKWKITYPMVVSQNTTILQNTTIPQETTVPPPYIHSAEEYKFASRNPRQAILERIKANIQNGVIPPPINGWFYWTNNEMDDYLKDVWLAVVPFFLDSVDEEGLYQSRPDVTTEHETNLFYGDSPNTGVWSVPN